MSLNSYQQGYTADALAFGRFLSLIAMSLFVEPVSFFLLTDWRHYGRFYYNVSNLITTTAFSLIVYNSNINNESVTWLITALLNIGLCTSIVAFIAFWVF